MSVRRPSTLTHINTIDIDNSRNKNNNNPKNNVKRKIKLSKDIKVNDHSTDKRRPKGQHNATLGASGGRKIRNQNNSLCSLTINFQSALPKKLELWRILENTDPDIIFGSETWLSPEIPSNELFPKELGYEVYRKDRPDGYGGVLLAVKTFLDPCEINIKTKAEAVFATLGSKPKVIVGSVYRTNSANTLEQMEELTNCLQKLDSKNVLWISGDLNLPDIDWTTEAVVRHQYPTQINDAFLDKMHDLGLTQINNVPTRQGNVLDVFLTNRPNLIEKNSIIPGVSDHDIIVTESKITAQKTVKRAHVVTVWKRANISAIQEETKTFSDDFLHQNFDDVEEAWGHIHQHLKSMLKDHIPTKMSSTKFHQPWISNKLKRLARRKQKAWSRAKQSKKPQDVLHYKDMKNAVRNENRKSYESYVKTLIDDDKNKNMWRFIKSRKCDSVGVSPLADQNRIYTTDKEKADILNKQFCSVFTPSDGETTSQPNTTDHPIMPDIVINVNGVEKLLTNLNVKKAAGPDGIPPRLLKMVAKEISPALTKLFQLSIAIGTVPRTWKHAYVQPIFKKGDRSEAQNYRPISLTCICCKLLEHVIRTEMTKHLESNNILNDVQHGFRKHRSCETQLVSFTDDLSTEIDRGGQMDVIFLDFAKAFDKVSHQNLINKLYSVGIQNKTLKWISAFLTDRTQQVVVNGEVSHVGQVTSGVPQGSVLGPSLFLVYINNIPDDIKSNLRLFADDTAIYKSIKSETDCEALNEDLARLQKWEVENQMKFNVSKCNVLSVTNKKKPVKFDYKLHNQNLKHVKSAKYLGVEFTSNLKWSTHINQLASRANKTSAYIHRNLKGCPIPVQTQAFQAVVRPTLEYCSTIWDPHHQKDIDTLEKCQNRAARRIARKFSPRESASKIKNNIGLETLESRRKIKKLTTFHNIVHNKISVGLPTNVNRATRKTRGHETKFVLPQSRTNSHRHSFFPSTVRLWNDLPPEAAETNCPDLFQRIMNAHKRSKL